MRRYLCGVPKDNCTGTGVAANQSLHKFQKVHSSPQEAFACHARHLISQGYVKIGSKEFSKPGEPVRVLTRPGKFGGVMRAGKTGETGKAAGSNTRVVPKSVGKGVKGGIIMSV